MGPCAGRQRPRAPARRSFSLTLAKNPAKGLLSDRRDCLCLIFLLHVTPHVKKQAKKAGKSYAKRSAFPFLAALSKKIRGSAQRDFFRAFCGGRAWENLGKIWRLRLAGCRSDILQRGLAGQGKPGRRPRSAPCRPDSAQGLACQIKGRGAPSNP